ncbi:hypothetical protein [Deinococcus indicus]|uniref:hypothetical protein n=1 Tax=Deinococcus indicus TaxID=223556 RepID=UPI00174D21C7|nr:hypothetical protein [Deinococcus indicus]
MIQALLDGRKTQTRRILKPQPSTEAATQSTPYSIGPAVARDTGVYSMNDHDRMPKEPGVFDAYGSVGVVRAACGQTTWVCPYGVPGDRLWVQENHQITEAAFGTSGTVRVQYGADGTTAVRSLTDAECQKFDARSRPFARHPGRFMYRSLSRLTLEITGVRLERLHDISEADAQAEGITAEEYRDAMGSYTGAYSALWERINGADSWNLNPYVWVVEFKTLEASA